MFPNARTGHRKWSDHSSRIPIPLSVVLFNLLIAPVEGQRRSSSGSKFFFPEHRSSLLRNVKLEIIVNNGDNMDNASQVVYSSASSNQSVHPRWDHLDERIDLPENWWKLDDLYRSMKFRISVLEDKELENLSALVTTNVTLCELSAHPTFLQRINSIPDTLPPNSVCIFFSDGSIRVSQSLFQILLDVNLTQLPQEVENFSRFEDDVFRTLDSVSPRRLNERQDISASSLLEQKPSTDESDDGQVEPITSSNIEVQGTTFSFQTNMIDVSMGEMSTGKAFLELLLSQEEVFMDQEMVELREVRN